MGKVKDLYWALVRVKDLGKVMEEVVVDQFVVVVGVVVVLRQPDLSVQAGEDCQKFPVLVKEKFGPQVHR